MSILRRNALWLAHATLRAFLCRQLSHTSASAVPPPQCSACMCVVGAYSWKAIHIAKTSTLALVHHSVVANLRSSEPPIRHTSGPRCSLARGGSPRSLGDSRPRHEVGEHGAEHGTQLGSSSAAGLSGYHYAPSHSSCASMTEPDQGQGAGRRDTQTSATRCRKD